MQYFSVNLGYLLLTNRNFHIPRMMTLVTIFFWISLGILFYCYAGYGVILFLLTRIKQFFAPRKEKQSEDFVLPVTLIVTAYNEKIIIENKIANTLSLDYPPNKLNIIFITDGSIDGSEEIVRKFPSIVSMHLPERKGKYAAIKRAMKQVQTPIVVFSDANTILNAACIKNIAAHYANEKTGGVAGEKKITRHKTMSAVGEAEGLYWQYESFMKKLDAGFNTVTGAAGELFSIRTALFKELEDDLILDDFVISMQICLEGYRIEYEPEAFAIELPSASLTEEEKRKVRISAGAYQSIVYLKECLNIFKYPLLSFQYISRRLLRWVFCPIMLVILLLSNFLLICYQVTDIFYNGFLVAQIVFYLFAFAGWLLVRAGKRAGLFGIPFYFVFMNYCLVKGFIKFVKGKQSVLWEKSMRQAVE